MLSVIAAAVHSTDCKLLRLLHTGDTFFLRIIGTTHICVCPFYTECKCFTEREG